jgi:hypothetical protein
MDAIPDPQAGNPAALVDAVCDVCLEGDWTEDNQIVFCEGTRCAGIAAHQQCYGILSIPEGDEPWLCDVCQQEADVKAGIRVSACEYTIQNI